MADAALFGPPSDTRRWMSNTVGMPQRKSGSATKACSSEVDGVRSQPTISSWLLRPVAKLWVRAEPCSAVTWPAMEA